MPPNITKTKRKLPKNEAEREQARLQSFLDMNMPSVIKCYPAYYISGNTYRSTWAVREYPAETSQQAILRHIGEKSGVTLKLYSRHVSAMEEKKILQNATNKNRLQSSSSTDLQQNVIAQANLNDMAQIIADNRKSREPFLHIAVYIEMSAFTLEKLQELQTDVLAELTRSKIAVDKLFLQQQEGYKSVSPFGVNIFKDQFERVLPASSAANLYPLNYSGKTDPNGFYLGHDKYGSNIIVDFEKRDDDKTNSNILVLGNSGQGKSYLLKFIITNMRLAGKNINILDAEMEYVDLTLSLGGTYIDMTTGEYIINPLQPKLHDEDNGGKAGHSKLSQHISFLRSFFKSYKNFTDSQIDTIEIMLQKLYRQFNISDQSNWQELEPMDYPILENLYALIKKEYADYDDRNHNIYTKECLQEILLGINSMCIGADSKMFNGHTNIVSDEFICFGVKKLLNSDSNVLSAQLFNILSYLTDSLLTTGNTAAFIDEFYLFLTNLTAVTYVRDFMKRVRKKDSSMVLSSQNIEDFTIKEIAELTKPLFAIPTHQFIFNCGSIDKKVYMDLLQLEETEYELIQHPQRGVCLFKCGIERYNLVIKAPNYKAELFGSAGGK